MKIRFPDPDLECKKSGGVGKLPVPPVAVGSWIFFSAGVTCGQLIQNNMSQKLMISQKVESCTRMVKHENSISKARCVAKAEGLHMVRRPFHKSPGRSKSIIFAMRLEVEKTCLSEHNIAPVT
jgi:hypothetical protein